MTTNLSLTLKIRKLRLDTFLVNGLPKVNADQLFSARSIDTHRFRATDQVSVVKGCELRDMIRNLSRPLSDCDDFLFYMVDRSSDNRRMKHLFRCTHHDQETSHRCNKVFTTLKALQEHIILHTEEKMYRCPFANCGKELR